MKCAAASANASAGQPASAVAASDEYLSKWRKEYAAYLAENPEAHKAADSQQGGLLFSFNTLDPETLSTFEDLTAGLEYDVAQHLPGPLQDVGPGKRYPTKYDALAEHQFHAARGNLHVYYRTLQERYGHNGKSSNFVVPVVRFARTDGGGGKLLGPYVAQQVVLCHPDDCERVARAHVKKQPFFTGTLMSSIISTTDNDNWNLQRQELNEAFLPNASLSKLLPIRWVGSRRQG